MNEYYQGRVAVVTGAASGIGLGIAGGLLERGAMAVYMADKNGDNLNRESAVLNERFPGKSFAAPTDVTDRAQVEKLINTAGGHDGHLDFVFNNAGMGMTLPTELVTPEIWDLVIDLNFKGVVYGTYAAIPVMRKQGFGHIVNTASITGLVPVPYQALYASTKAAVLMMTESLQYELENEGLSFSVVCPGNVATPIFGQMAPPPDAISVEDAVDYILAEVEKKSLEIVFSQTYRDMAKLYREDRPAFDKLARGIADERRENYRTKGTYY
ncbi:MAG: SDR family oxidoreductase [Desulfobacterales bacterium]|nr:SDR family oxidoreductase [Desulfobacterales bacterium]